MKSLSKTVTISHFATTFNNFALKIERMVNPLNVSVASNRNESIDLQSKSID